MTIENLSFLMASSIVPSDSEALVSLGDQLYLPIDSIDADLNRTLLTKEFVIVLGQRKHKHGARPFGVDVLPMPRSIPSDFSLRQSYGNAAINSTTLSMWSEGLSRSPRICPAYSSHTRYSFFPLLNVNVLSYRV
jgi:hypothetical protein